MKLTDAGYVSSSLVALVSKENGVAISEAGVGCKLIVGGARLSVFSTIRTFDGAGRESIFSEGTMKSFGRMLDQSPLPITSDSFSICFLPHILARLPVLSMSSAQS